MEKFRGVNHKGQLVDRVISGFSVTEIPVDRLKEWDLQDARNEITKMNNDMTFNNPKKSVSVDSMYG